MALTYIETVRLLMGDLDEGDNNFFSGEQWVHLFETWSYDNDAGDRELSLLDVANAALNTLSVYHATNSDEIKAQWFQKRTDELGRLPAEIKAEYVVDGQAPPTAIPDNALTVHEVAADAARAARYKPSWTRTRRVPTTPTPRPGAPLASPRPRLTCMS